MSKLTKSFFGGAEKDAGKQLAAGYRASGAEYKKQGEEIRKLFEPYVQPGREAFQQTAALSGALGPEQEQQAINQFMESPGQAFLRQRAERALLRNQAAIGGLGGGNVRQALQEQAIGIAAQQQQQRLANLGAISDVGMGALTQQAQSRQFQTGGVSQGLIGAAQAKSAGTIGQAAGFRSGVGQLVQGVGAIFSDKRLKESLEKTGESKSGLNIYKFKYKDGDNKFYQGVIAQEILKKHPEAVKQDENGFYSVDYDKIDVEFKELNNG